jgi:hypothetical protein
MSDTLDTGALLANIRANRDRVEGCKRHRIIWPAIRRFGMKLDCAACGGKLSLSEVGAYVRGYMAAGGNPDDVAPWWNQPLTKED